MMTVHDWRAVERRAPIVSACSLASSHVRSDGKSVGLDGVLCAQPRVLQRLCGRGSSVRIDGQQCRKEIQEAAVFAAQPDAQVGAARRHDTAGNMVAGAKQRTRRQKGDSTGASKRYTGGSTEPCKSHADQRKRAG